MKSGLENHQDDVEANDAVNEGATIQLASRKGDVRRTAIGDTEAIGIADETAEGDVGAAIETDEFKRVLQTRIAKRETRMTLDFTRADGKVEKPVLNKVMNLRDKVKKENNMTLRLVGLDDTEAAHLHHQGTVNSKDTEILNAKDTRQTFNAEKREAAEARKEEEKPEAQDDDASLEKAA